MTALKLRTAFPTVDLSRDVNRMFDEIWGTFPNGNENGAWTPRVDTVEYEDRYELHLDLPGVTKEHVTINFHEGVLTVNGERPREFVEEGRTYFRTERLSGPFSRSFRFRDRIQTGEIKASFENGVLTITVPKAEESKPRTIEIK